MNETAKAIIEMLLAVPEMDRKDVLDEVLNNGIFCEHCGMGSVERPNDALRCQCWNDE